MQVAFDRDDLRGLVRQTVADTLAELEARAPDLDGRLAYSESEAADLLGLRSHQLRDLRLKGKIGFSRIVGRRIRYTRQHLLEYLVQCEESGR